MQFCVHFKCLNLRLNIHLKNICIIYEYFLNECFFVYKGEKIDEENK